jgi:uncharacterized protein
LKTRLQLSPCLPWISTRNLKRFFKTLENTRFMRRLLQIVAKVWWILALFVASVQAQTLLPVPALTAQVIDQTSTLSAADKAALTNTLAGIAQQRGSQVVVLIVATTQGEPIEDFANRVGNSWKIGRKGVGDGVLLIAAIQDRKVRLEVARNLEGAIPDVTAKRIIRESIAPAFQQGRYAQGIDAALHRIDERLALENLPAPGAAPSESVQSAGIEDVLPMLLIGVVVAMVLRGMFGGFGSGMAAVGTGFMAWNTGFALAIAGGLGFAVLVFSIILASMRGAGNYRGHGGGIPFPNSGGGGFSSGGGGDFGGGGASGDW